MGCLAISELILEQTVVCLNILQILSESSHLGAQSEVFLLHGLNFRLSLCEGKQLGFELVTFLLTSRDVGIEGSELQS